MIWYAEAAVKIIREYLPDLQIADTELAQFIETIHYSILKFHTPNPTIDSNQNLPINIAFAFLIYLRKYCLHLQNNYKSNLDNSLLGQILISTFGLAVKTEMEKIISYADHDYETMLLISAIEIESFYLANQPEIKKAIMTQLNSFDYNPEKTIFNQIWFNNQDADVKLSNIIEIIRNNNATSDEDSLENKNSFSDSDNDYPKFFLVYSTMILNEWERRLLKAIDWRTSITDIDIQKIRQLCCDQKKLEDAVKQYLNDIIDDALKPPNLEPLLPEIKLLTSKPVTPNIDRSKSKKIKYITRGNKAVYTEFLISEIPGYKLGIVPPDNLLKEKKYKYNCIILKKIDVNASKARNVNKVLSLTSKQQEELKPYFSFSNKERSKVIRRHENPFLVDKFTLKCSGEMIFEPIIEAIYPNKIQMNRIDLYIFRDPDSKEICCNFYSFKEAKFLIQEITHPIINCNNFDSEDHKRILVIKELTAGLNNPKEFSANKNLIAAVIKIIGYEGHIFKPAQISPESNNENSKRSILLAQKENLQYFLAQIQPLNGLRLYLMSPEDNAETRPYNIILLKKHNNEIFAIKEDNKQEIKLELTEQDLQCLKFPEQGETKIVTRIENAILVDKIILQYTSANVIKSPNDIALRIAILNQHIEELRKEFKQPLNSHFFSHNELNLKFSICAKELEILELRLILEPTSPSLNKQLTAKMEEKIRDELQLVNRDITRLHQELKTSELSRTEYFKRKIIICEKEIVSLTLSKKLGPSTILEKKIELKNKEKIFIEINLLEWHLYNLRSKLKRLEKNKPYNPQFINSTEAIDATIKVKKDKLQAEIEQKERSISNRKLILEDNPESRCHPIRSFPISYA